MDTFEKCVLIQRIILNRAAAVIAYDNWEDEFAANHIREIPEEIQERQPHLFGVDPSDLTDDQCEQLGFGLWSDNNPMRLIPLYLLPFLADELRATSISGQPATKRDKMDNDARFGCLAYGIIPSDVSVESS